MVYSKPPNEPFDAAKIKPIDIDNGPTKAAPTRRTSATPAPQKPDVEKSDKQVKRLSQKITPDTSDATIQHHEHAVKPLKADTPTVPSSTPSPAARHAAELAKNQIGAIAARVLPSIPTAITPATTPATTQGAPGYSGPFRRRALTPQSSTESSTAVVSRGPFTRTKRTSNSGTPPMPLVPRPNLSASTGERVSTEKRASTGEKTATKNVATPWQKAARPKSPPRTNLINAAKAQVATANNSFASTESNYGAVLPQFRLYTWDEHLTQAEFLDQHDEVIAEMDKDKPAPDRENRLLSVFTNLLQNTNNDTRELSEEIVQGNKKMIGFILQDLKRTEPFHEPKVKAKVHELISSLRKKMAPFEKAQKESQTPAETTAPPTSDTTASVSEKAAMEKPLPAVPKSLLPPQTGTPFPNKPPPPKPTPPAGTKN